MNVWDLHVNIVCEQITSKTGKTALFDGDRLRLRESASKNCRLSLRKETLVLKETDTRLK